MNVGVHGWIILAEDGTYLTAEGWWGPFEDIHQTYVHTEEDLEGIREKAKTWKTKPFEKIAAVYKDGEGVTILDNPKPF